MLRLLLKPFSFLIAVAVLLAACSTTQINAAWKDPSYQVHPRKVMVIGVAKSPVNRRVFEDEFVRQLQARGTNAIASYTVLSDKKQNDRSVIADKVMKLGADTVLITRLVDKKTVKVYVPGTPYFPPHHYGRWRDYYGYGYEEMYTPGYMAETEYAVMETNLYDAGNDRLIWAATSETGLLGANQNLIKSFIEVMVKTMVGQDVLAR
jgi:hypothetical protein